MTMILRQRQFMRDGRHARRLTPNARFLWTVMNDRTNTKDGVDQDFVWPSLETLAKQLGGVPNPRTGRIDTKAVRTAIDELLGLGYLQPVGKSDQGTIEYRVCVPCLEGDSRSSEGNLPSSEGGDWRVNHPTSEGDSPSKMRVNHPPKCTGKGKEKSTPSRESEAFNRFWEAVLPAKREDEPECRAAWRRLGLDAVVDDVVAGYARWRALPRWQDQHGRFAKNTLKFLENAQWKNDPNPPTARPTPAPPPAKREDDASRAEFERERRELEAALDAVDRNVLELAKAQVIHDDGETGRVAFAKVDPHDKHSRKSNWLRIRIAELLNSGWKPQTIAHETVS